MSRKDNEFISTGKDVNKFKVGDYVIYSDRYYWKVYKILEVIEHWYAYKCLASSYSDNNHNGKFEDESIVGSKGNKVSKLEAMAYILAKKL